MTAGVNWYDSNLLSRLDILITFLDDYNLTKAYQHSYMAIPSFDPHTARKSYQSNDDVAKSLKPTIFFIAWMRNWYERWLMRPWIGNYDMLMISSPSTKHFFEQYDRQYKFMCQCFNGCSQNFRPQLVIDSRIFNSTVGTSKHFSA
jgi:hypothetical protein